MKITVGVDKVVGDTYSIRVGVHDSGIGIPADKIDTIFESFGQASSDTTRKFGGTGLGLTISKQLVEMHGGELKVNSVVGEGSEFYFIIDYKKTDKPAEEKLDNFDDVASLKGKKILLVEDNQFNQMVAVDTINDIFPDIQVDVAENGKVAIEMLQKDDYAFLFMDIQMPEMDGYEATRQIRSSLSEPKRSVRICAMTANVTKEEIDKCTEVGMNDYMMKPFTHEILREKIIRNATGN
ncbi:MAG: response regulator [Bacteroidetes bacterium]|nr:response regulator [Bacteroidota bacterium]